MIEEATLRETIHVEIEERRNLQTGACALEKDDLRYLQNRISVGMGTKNLSDYHREETKKSLISFVFS
ncbi:MAG: hypothetical protein WCS87_20455 [Methylococcaceae bacterium]